MCPRRSIPTTTYQGKNLEHLKITLNDIKEAIKNFDDSYIIGFGGFGKVYKAELEHFNSSNFASKEGVDECDLPGKRSTVAIKRIHNQEGGQGFIAEIETLTSCKHDNIISLLGFCYQGDGAMILVYEHASKGSLESYLGNSDKMTTLTWVQRLNICLDIAHGLNYIHNNTDHGKQKMLHRDIKSDNILLGDNWKAKIADFGLSKFHPTDQLASTFYTSMIAAYDSVYTEVNEKGIAPIARDRYKTKTIMEIVDHKIKEETDEHVFSLCKGPNKESLDMFLEIALRCAAETQAQRPTIEVVINQLKKALDSQENHKDNLKLSLEDIKLATKGFSQDNIIGHGDSWNVYKGATHSFHGDNIIAAKRLDKNSGQGDVEVLTEVATAKFMAELDILMEYKHLNVVGLVGYCDEEDEKSIVCEYASRGSLDKYLSDDSLTWVMRLKICIDIAVGLEFLHGTVSSQEMVMHRDISSSNILLFDDWKAKIIALAFLKLDDAYIYLPFLAKQHYHVGKLDKLVFEGIKEQIVAQSYTTFTRIALQCLHHRRERRPTASEVILQLKKALEFQLLSFDGIGERNAMVSATMFSYKNSCPHEWKSLPESRFESVADISDVSNLNMEIKTDTRLLSPNVVYRVYLLFKICDSKGKRDEEWMMIELYQFMNQKDDVMFTFLLESFSSYYFGESAIYVEGIEFRAINKVRHENIIKLMEGQQVLKSNFNLDQVQQLPTNFEEIFKIHRNYDELFWLGEVNGKKLLVLSAKATLYKFSDVFLFTSKPSAHSRFQVVLAELLHKQVFLFNCTIRSQMLSADTEYVCYLVFKLSEEYQGLHNPVRARDLLHRENKEAEFFYFINPSPLNINGITRVSKEREDGNGW
ncbi:kinase-like domain, phloem protein 2-like protein [Tanacetum coccineum]